MENASQARTTSNRKRTKPEESLPSCSGKMSRTGEQHGCSLELLPEEMVVSIFKLLPSNDLLACRAVCKRFVLIIGDNVLLDKANAFWKQFAQPPVPALFSPDRYVQVLRPWFETFVTAQQRLAGAASDDLQFSDSMREKNERQASSEQTEQVQAIKSSQVKQLDRLIKHGEFPKTLFFIQAKTLQNAESLCFQEKFSHSCPAIFKTVCFSPDGRNLLISFDATIRFMVLDGNGNVVRQYDKYYSSSVKELLFSPDGCSLLIGFYANIVIMGLDGEDWVKKGENEYSKCVYWLIDDYKPGDIKKTVYFSPDSHSLAIVFNHSVRVMGRDETGNWVQNASISFSRPREVSFSSNGCLAISGISDVWIMGRDENGNWVKQNCRIPDRNNHFQMLSTCFSPDGDSFVISARRGYNPGSFVMSVHIMVSDGKGNWVQDWVIPCTIAGRLCFSPDGRALMLNYVGKSLIIGFDGANHTVCPYTHTGNVICFSPDGGSFAMSHDSTTVVMGLNKGKWVKKACIPNEEQVRAVCYSPDGRGLAMVLTPNGGECGRSQVKIYEIKQSGPIAGHPKGRGAHLKPKAQASLVNNASNNQLPVTLCKALQPGIQGSAEGVVTDVVSSCVSSTIQKAEPVTVSIPPPQSVPSTSTQEEVPSGTLQRPEVAIEDLLQRLQSTPVLEEADLELLEIHRQQMTSRQVLRVTQKISDRCDAAIQLEWYLALESKKNEELREKDHLELERSDIDLLASGNNVHSYIVDNIESLLFADSTRGLFD